MYCSNCGQQLADEAKYCSNCGAPVQTGAPDSSSAESDRERERREDFERAWGSSTPSPSAASNESDTSSPSSSDDDQSYEGGFADRKATWEVEREKLRDQSNDEWAMFDLGPPKPQRRRRWLWVLLGMIAFIVIACCVFGWWITATESGTQWFEGIATQAAEEMQRATESAATPEP